MAKAIVLHFKRCDYRRVVRVLRKTRDARTRLWCEIVFWAGHGLPVAVIADQLLCSHDTVIRRIRAYQREGAAALRPKPRPGRRHTVTEEYVQALLEAVRQNPRTLGKNFSNWSTPQLAKHLAVGTGIRVHATTVWRHLQRMGWRFRRPVRVVTSPDPRYKAKRRYLVRLKLRARRGEIHLYFVDEFDIDLLPTIAGCWMPQGQQYKVQTPGQNRKHYGLGAVDYVTGRLIWCLAEHKDNVAFRRLLTRIEQVHQEEHIPVVIVVDNFIIHKARKVQERLAGRRRHMRLYFLPTYSPTLNPIERLWRHFRRRVTDNCFFTTMTQLLHATCRFFEELAAQPETVLSIINGNA